MKNNSVLIMAGGTGGHVFPGLALATELLARGVGVQWLGTATGIEARLVPEAGIPLHLIPVRGIRGKSVRAIFTAPWNIMISLRETLRVIRQIKPAVVVGLGGFVSGPGGVAAKLLGIPLVLHEQNAVAGTTNTLLARIATKVLTGFPLPLPKAICIGNPVREAIESLPEPQQRLHKRSDSVRLLIVGGSRGALAINELVPAAVALLPRQSGIEIWHQAGEHKEIETINRYQQHDVVARVEPFIDDMSAALAWADFVVCRSGALTVAELAAAGLGALLIPFPYAIDDHQTANAQFLVQAEAAIIVQQRELTPEKLAAVFSSVLFDRAILLQMAIKARALAKPAAAKRFADYCEDIINGNN